MFYSGEFGHVLTNEGHGAIIMRIMCNKRR